jgi:hypothetical protein
MITITGPKSLTLPSALGGDDQTYALTLVCVSRGLTVNDSPGATTVTIEGIRDTGLVSFAILELLASKGADVLNYPAFFELDDVTALCPFAPSDLVDEEGDPIPQETWETWGVSGNSHQPVQIGAKWYRSNQYGYGGEYLPASDWIAWKATPPTGLRLITVDEFKAINVDVT